MQKQAHNHGQVKPKPAFSSRLMLKQSFKNGNLGRVAVSNINSASSSLYTPSVDG